MFHFLNWMIGSVELKHAVIDRQFYGSVNNEISCAIKAKAIPLQAWTDLEGSRRLRLPDFKTIGKAVSPAHRLPLPPWEVFLVLISVRG